VPLDEVFTFSLEDDQKNLTTNDIKRD
jgi:hypothetical protein